nr:hypothetical protein GCM10025730_49490 [Promicromonospora thailandica]
MPAPAQIAGPCQSADSPQEVRTSPSDPNTAVAAPTTPCQMSELRSTNYCIRESPEWAGGMTSAPAMVEALQTASRPRTTAADLRRLVHGWDSRIVGDAHRGTSWWRDPWLWYR